MGAPFVLLDAFVPQRVTTSPTDGRTLSHANQCYGLNSITDGSSNTIMAAEVIQGQSNDNRGLTWWGDASGISTSLLPNSPLTDVLASATCVPPVPRRPARPATP